MGRKPNELKERERLMKTKAKSEGDGYYSINALRPWRVAYVCIPAKHPDVGKHYDELRPDVNGGLTFARGRCFGWDYQHYHNDYNVEQHIKNAIAYFKARVAE